MSQTAWPSALPSTGRGWPRWSEEGQPVLVPASMAGLPESRAWVWVGPLLLARGPSLGSLLLRSPGWLKPQLAPLSRLNPCDVIGPEQLAPTVLLATIVFLRVMVPEKECSMPPPTMLAPLLAIVPLVIVTVPSVMRTPPPMLLAVLSLMVTLVAGTVPWL